MPDPNDLTIEIKFDGSTSIPGDQGKDVELKNGKYIQRFQVDQKLGSPDYFSIQLQMSEFKDIMLLDKIKPGAEVEIKVGYATEATIFKGEVSYIEPHFAAGDMSVAVSGYDGSHRLTRGTSSRTFGNGLDQDQDYGTILGTVVSDSKGLKGDKSDGLAAQTQDTGAKAEYIAQYNMNDFQFIQQVVGNFGLGWGSNSHDNGKQVSLKAIEKGSKTLKICREKYNPESEAVALSADFLCSTVKQVAKVEVRSWCTKKKEPILGKAEALTLTIGGTEGFKQAGQAHFGSQSAGRVVTIVDVPVASVDEGNKVAQSIMDKLSMDWMTASIVIEGRPELHAGQIVELSDFGVRYSGEYLVEGCQHVYIGGSGHTYRTYLNLARNGSPEP